jgi:hypothetical protein
MKTTLRPAPEPRDEPETIPPAASIPSGWIQGTVTAVSAAPDRALLRTPDTQRRDIIRLAPTSRFPVNGTPASRHDLAPGQRILIHCCFADAERAAEPIEIEPDPGPGGSPPPAPPSHPGARLRRDDTRS